MPLNTAGSFTVALNAEFVKYAHFIDQFQDAGSGDPWMSYRHVYTGPVHTNTRFSILGDINTAGNEGPVFKSEATQTLTTTRFNNAGSATNLSRDSSSKDWPLLGPDPGILCKSVDCSGFTRGFDADPNTSGIQPIPFPASGTLGTADDARKQEICVALGYMNERMPLIAMMSTMAVPGRDVSQGTSARARRATRAKPPTVQVTRGFRCRAASAARAPGKRETAPRRFWIAASNPSWLVLAPYASAYRTMNPT